jgi:hypothetical protein
MASNGAGATGQKLAISLIVIALMMEVLLWGGEDQAFFACWASDDIRPHRPRGACNLDHDVTGFVVTIMTFGISVELGRIVNRITSQYGWTRRLRGRNRVAKAAHEDDSVTPIRAFSDPAESEGIPLRGKS